MTATPQQTVEEFMAAWSKQDVEHIVALVAPDVVYEDLGVQQTFRGPDGVRAFAEAVIGAVPDLGWTPLRMIADGPLVATEWLLTGSQTGDFPGIPATGKPVEVIGFGFTEVADGLICHHRDCFNLVAYLQQVGLMPPAEG